ncbi:MAG: hypothetical protein K5849_06840 [Bacteroidales bacterium]|nr:hypothetical protein [Bacteroidales bacterium]
MAQQHLLRLDNASFIYPASQSKKYSSLYRMSVTLSEPVDAGILQQALEATVRRIPTFHYTLSEGALWWYLRFLDKTPRVLPMQPLHHFDIAGNGGFLFRVAADDCRIVLDIFHVLTDGNGGMTFLLTLAAEYLRLRYGVMPVYGGRILDPSEKPCASELADAFDDFSGKRGALEQNDPAYHIRGRVLGTRELRNLRIRIPMIRACEVAKARQVTVTELLSAAMVAALQDVRSTDPFKRRSALKVNVPVDLRRIFGGSTLRNFSSYVMLGVDVRNGEYDFDHILEVVSAQKRLFSMQSQLEPKVAKNVELENNFAINCIPRFLKKPIIDVINKLKGDRYCSHTLSNLGKIDLPASLRPYVRDIDFVLGRQRGNSGASACVGYNGELILNMSRRIAERRFEDAFLEQLEQLGIPVAAEESDI